MNTPSGERGYSGFGVETDQMHTAAGRVQRLLELVGQLNQTQLEPDNDTAVGHSVLARALRESAPAWGRALAVITEDLQRIAERLSAEGRSRRRADDDIRDHANRLATRTETPTETLTDSNNRRFGPGHGERSWQR